MPRRAAHALAGAALLGLASLPATEVLAQSQNTFVSGVWSGQAFFSSEDATFSHCLMVAEFDREITLIFALDRSGALSFGVRNPRWDLPVQSSPDLTMTLDHGWTGTPAIEALEPNLILGPIGLAEDVLAPFARASFVSIDVGVQRFDFALIGAEAAFRALAACADEAGAPVAVAGQPVSIDISAADSISEQVDLVAVDPNILATTMAQSLLQSAGLGHFELMPREGSDIFLANARAVWTDGAIYGALFTVAERARGADAAIAEVIESISAGCQGVFEEYDIELADPLPFGMARRGARCREGDVIIAMRAVAIVQASGTMVIVHAGLREDLSVLADSDDRIAEALAENLGGLR